MKTCSLQRFIVSWWSEGGKAWPSFTKKHLEKCADCRNWWQEQRALEARLSDGAGGRDLSPGFTSEVMRKIEVAGPVSDHQPRLGWKLAVAGAFGLAGILLLMNFKGNGPQQTQENRAATAEFGEVRSLVKRNAETLKQLPEKVEDPLEKELELVISDTKKAFAFVADSLVPEDYRSRR